MMRFFVLLSTLLLFAIGQPAGAAVSERDWQAPGDGLLTYDDVNRREWLDLTVSRLDQFPEPWLEHAVTEIAPGGLFEGFKWAKRDDVISLAESAGIDTTTLNPFVANNEIPVTELMELLGVTFQVSQPIIAIRSTGFIDETDDIGRQIGAVFQLNKNPTTGQVGLAGLHISAGDDFLRLGTTGLMLCRAVPEPSELCGVALAVYLLMLTKLRHRRAGGPPQVTDQGGSDRNSRWHMTRLLVLALTVLPVFIGNPTAAAVFERDWQAPGDGLLTYDDVNRREWLDLTVSRLDQFLQPWLENAVAEIAPAGLFEGFKWAKQDDVIWFAESAGIDTTTSNPSNNRVSAAELMTLIGITVESSFSVRSIGFIDETDDFGRQVGSEVFVYKNSITGQAISAGIYISASNDLLRLGSTGVMLYRAVPEPSAICTMALSLYALSMLRRTLRS